VSDEEGIRFREGKRGLLIRFLLEKPGSRFGSTMMFWTGSGRRSMPVAGKLSNHDEHALKEHIKQQREPLEAIIRRVSEKN